LANGNRIYTKSQAHSIVHDLYVEILDRNPDSGGAGYFYSLLEKGEVNEQWVRETITQSNEGQFIQEKRQLRKTQLKRIRTLYIYILLLCTFFLIMRKRISAFLFNKTSIKESMLNHVVAIAIIIGLCVSIYSLGAFPKHANAGDNFWYVPTSLSIVTEHNIDLNEYQEDLAKLQPTEAWQTNMTSDTRLLPHNGYYYNKFPLGTSISISPLTALLKKISPPSGNILSWCLETA
jgi:hypothetical protein